MSIYFKNKPPVTIDKYWMAKVFGFTTLAGLIFLWLVSKIDMEHKVNKQFKHTFP